MKSIIKKFVESGEPLFICDVAIRDKEVGYFGVVIWAKDDGERYKLNFDTFYIGIDEDSPIVQLWEECVDELPDMIFEHRDTIPFIPATCKEEVMYKVYKEVFNKAA